MHIILFAASYWQLQSQTRELFWLEIVGKKELFFFFPHCFAEKLFLQYAHFNLDMQAVKG